MIYFWQQIYAYQLFSLSDLIPTKDILPVTLQIRDRNTQREDEPELDSIWANNQNIAIYGQQLAYQVFIRFSIDPAKKTELIWTILCLVFPRELVINDKNRAILEAKAGRNN